MQPKLGCSQILVTALHHNRLGCRFHEHLPHLLEADGCSLMIERTADWEEAKLGLLCPALSRDCLSPDSHPGRT